jgi:hypothetical protein
MTACVLCHNERFLLGAVHPILKPYRGLRIFLPVVGIIGACAPVLASMQFRSDCLHAAAWAIGHKYVVCTDHPFDASNASMREASSLDPS